MKKLKISIVITSYNKAQFIEETINSALNQTFKDHEIVFVDDGSTDNTKEILGKYKNKIKYYYKKNGGHSDAKNYGVRKARGKYIAFLDGDDVWFQDKLESNYAVLNEDPAISLVYSNFSIIDQDGKTTLREFDLDSLKQKYPSILLGNFIGFSGAIVKKDCFKELGFFYSELDMYEDWDFWNRVIEKHKFCLINKPLFYYRAINQDKFTKKQIKLRLKRQLLVLKRAFSRDKTLPFFFRLNCISNVYFETAKACFFRRQYLDVIKLLFICCFLFPFRIKFSYLMITKYMNKKFHNIYNGFLNLNQDVL